MLSGVVIAVTLLSLGAAAAEIIAHLRALPRTREHDLGRTAHANRPNVESPDEDNTHCAQSSWAEHDSILHDLSNAMTASLFIVRDLTRTLEKRPEPGLGRAKSLAQALAKELSEISDQIRSTRQSARVQAIGEALALVEPLERCIDVVSRLHPESVCRFQSDLTAREAVVTIAGGEATLKRIVENLVLNACQAQGGSENKVQIVFQMAASETLATLVMEDNGPGFPGVILDTFPSPSLSTKPQGTGMGLYSCHQLVVRDGGTLTLHNSEAGGAKVVISWPRLPATSGTIGAARQNPMSSSGTRTRPDSAAHRSTLAADER